MNATTDLCAPAGKYRVVGVDTFSHEDYAIGDYSTIGEAVRVASKDYGQMHKTHVYDDHGRNVFNAGDF